jgi:hypothetical protein
MTGTTMKTKIGKRNKRRNTGKKRKVKERRFGLE